MYIFLNSNAFNEILIIDIIDKYEEKGNSK